MEYISKQDWNWVNEHLLLNKDFTFKNNIITIHYSKFVKNYPRDNKYVTLDISYLNLCNLYIDARSKDTVEYICDELHKSNTKETYLKLIKENLVSKSSFFSLYEQYQLGLI